MKEKNNTIIGRNPVMEALRSGRTVQRLLVQKGSTGSMNKLLKLAREKGVPYDFVDKARLDKLQQGVHQGVIAYVSAYQFSELEDGFRLAEERGEAPFFVILDGIEDPHNLGAIMRTGECAGAHGIIVAKRHAAGLTDTVAKASAGAIEYMPVIQVANIARTVEALQKRNVWVYACDMGGPEYYRQDLKGAVGIVIGAEGTGISRLVKEKCDGVVSMPMVGKITSLNASNAAAVLMYEIRKQRDQLAESVRK